MLLVWTNAFTRASQRMLRGRPELKSRLAACLNRMAQDPFHPSLRSHKLKGDLDGVWACTVDYDHRVLFEVRRDPVTGEDEVLLLTAGTHDEVY